MAGDAILTLPQCIKPLFDNSLGKGLGLRLGLTIRVNLSVRMYWLGSPDISAGCERARRKLPAHYGR